MHYTTHTFITNLQFKIWNQFRPSKPNHVIEHNKIQEGEMQQENNN